MKVIDLLNKIANKEEIPKIFKYDIHTWTIDNEKGLYFNTIKMEFEDYMTNALFVNLNDEIKIIEDEPKKIENLYYIQITDNLLVSDACKELTKKINEIIDYINKGENNE